MLLLLSAYYFDFAAALLRRRHAAAILRGLRFSLPATLSPCCADACFAAAFATPLRADGIMSGDVARAPHTYY